jgi:aspartyl-tRNA(Asn)/glutamyl-tRNA(Gln) amidotransferase subunit A
MALCWTLDKIGPMCRTADDCGLVLSAIAGADPEDDTTIPTPFRYNPERVRTSGFRFGVLAGATEGVQPEVAENFNRSLEVLGEVGTFEEVTLPEFPYGPVTETILRAEAASAFDDFIASGKVTELAATETHQSPISYRFVAAKDYVSALRIRRLIVCDCDHLFAQYDTILCPTTNAVASPINVRFNDYFRTPGGRRPVIGAAGNVAGLPAISVPNGFGERGLPTALQFVGRAGTENTIIAAAHAYQQRTDWHMQRPEIA